MRELRSDRDVGQSLVFHLQDSVVFLSPTIVLRRQLYPAMSAAGIPRLGPTQEKRTFHSFRHTFAKRALESGAQVRGSLAISVTHRSR
jgi:integrase